MVESTMEVEGRSEAGRYEVLTISESVQYEMRVILMDLDNPGHQVTVILDQTVGNTISVREMQTQLQPRLGPIQITETYIGTVNPEENLQYYRMEPLYFKLCSEVIAKFCPSSSFEPFKLWLESPIHGPLLFREITAKTNLNLNNYYLYIEQEMEKVKISRSRTETEWDSNKKSTLFINQLRAGSTLVSIDLTLQEKVSIGIGEETTVAELKELIDIHHQVPCDASTLIYEGDPLSDDRRLRDVGIVGGSQITCYISNRERQQNNESYNYVDLEGQQGVKIIQFSKEANEWEIVRPGLCIEGKCENKDCDANGCSVIVNTGFGVISPVWDRPKFLCPICDQAVKGETTIAFNNCIYELHGEVIQDSKRVWVIQTPPPVGNEYVRYKPTDEWGCFKIATKRPEDKRVRCILCKKAVESDFGKLLCKHGIHENCEKFVKGCFICKPSA